MVPTLLAPDLRGSLRARERSQFLDVLMNGSQSAVVPGWVMPSWKEVIDDKLADDIFYYINARIDNILPPGRPDEVGLGGLPWEPPQKWSPPK